jgi:hypothetical protein
VLDELTAPRQDMRIHVLAPYFVSYYDAFGETSADLCEPKMRRNFRHGPGVIHECLLTASSTVASLGQWSSAIGASEQNDSRGRCLSITPFWSSIHHGAKIQGWRSRDLEL